MEKPEICEAIEAGDQRKSVYKAIFFWQVHKSQMMETTSVWNQGAWDHALYPCKAVPRYIFTDITWTKLAGNIPLTPRKTPAHQSLSTWQNIFKYFFVFDLGIPSLKMPFSLTPTCFNSVRVSFLKSSTNMIWAKKTRKIYPK